MPVAAEATKPTYGRTTWTNITNNWTANDTVWLQDRMVLRYADTTTRDASSPTAGQQAFSAAGGGTWAGYTGSSWKTFLAAANISLIDAAASAIRVTSQGAAGVGGVLVKVTGEVQIDASLAKAFNVNDKVWVDNTGSPGLVIGTAVGSTAKLTTSASPNRLNSDIEFYGAGGVTTPTLVSTNTLTVTGATTLNNPLTVNSTGQFSSAVTINGSFSANSTSNFASNVTLTGSGFLKLSTTGTLLAASGTAAVTLVGNSATASGADLLLDATNTVKFRTNSGQTQTNVAGVVVSSADPSGTYPNGTFWVVP